MGQSTKQLAIVRSYHQLLAVLRSRADELEITRQTLDSEGKQPPGYSAKLLSPLPIKNLGPNSLGALLGVLKLALVVVEDGTPSPDLPRRKYKRAHKPCQELSS